MPWLWCRQYLIALPSGLENEYLKFVSQLNTLLMGSETFGKVIKTPTQGSTISAIGFWLLSFERSLTFADISLSLKYGNDAVIILSDYQQPTHYCLTNL